MADKEKKRSPLNSPKLTNKHQSHADYDVEEHEEEEEEIRCGLGTLQPDWLQCAANPWTFIVVYSLAGLITASSWAYYSSTITTLEKRFSVSSKSVASLMVIAEISTLMCSFFVSYFAGHRNRARLIGAGIMLWGFSSLLMASPQLFFGSKHIMEFLDDDGEKPIALCTNLLQENQTYVEKCKTYTSVSTATGVSLGIMALGTFLMNIGGVAYHILGATYIDDNVDKKTSSICYATPKAKLESNTNLCIPFGYASKASRAVLLFRKHFGKINQLILASKTVSDFNNSHLSRDVTQVSNRVRMVNNDRGMKLTDERWIGCWWLGHIFISIPLLAFGFMLLWFPKSLRKKKTKSKTPEDGKMITNLNNLEKTKIEKPVEIDTSWSGIPKRTRPLLKNPVYICLTLAVATEMFSIYGIIYFLPKYLEQQFQITASEAVLYHGMAVILSLCGGFLLGGIITKVLQPSPRTIMLYVSFVCIVCCIVLSIQSTIKCDPLIESQKPFTEGSSKESAECRSDCSCDVNTFDPICVQNTHKSYFSPCILGCKVIQNNHNTTKQYEECSCLETQSESSMVNWTVVGGRCPNDCDSDKMKYLGLVVVFMACYGSSSIGHLLVSLRAVDKVDKTLAQGLQAIVFSLLGLIPAPLIFGEIFDSACILWDVECGHEKNCLVYDLDFIRYGFHFISFGGLFIAAIISLFAAKYANGIKNFYDNDNDIGYR
ncbi:Solute carrier organic anion transporter family member 3A1 [Nymphon striatum]|nr:Solute carrier organic anion transporter family member 3A1 [Nymphon striatum]